MTIYDYCLSLVNYFRIIDDYWLLFVIIDDYWWLSYGYWWLFIVILWLLINSSWLFVIGGYW